MEIKAILQKPYNESERLNFIIVQNHQLGYKIVETQTELQAWGYTQEEKEEIEKQNKIKEIDDKIIELNNESLEYIRTNDLKAIEIINDMITGLENTKKSL